MSNTSGKENVEHNNTALTGADKCIDFFLEDNDAPLVHPSPWALSEIDITNASSSNAQDTIFASEETTDFCQDVDRKVINWVAGLQRGDMAQVTTPESSNSLVLNIDLLYSGERIGKGLAGNPEFASFAKRVLDATKSDSSLELVQLLQILGEGSKVIKVKQAKNYVYPTPLLPEEIRETSSSILTQFQRKRARFILEMALEKAKEKGMEGVCMRDDKIVPREYNAGDQVCLKKDSWCFARQICLAMIFEVKKELKLFDSRPENVDKILCMDAKDLEMVTECKDMLDMEDADSGLPALKKKIESDAQSKAESLTKVREEKHKQKTGEGYKAGTKNTAIALCRAQKSSEYTMDWLKKCIRALQCVTAAIGGPAATTNISRGIVSSPDQENVPVVSIKSSLRPLCSESFLDEEEILKGMYSPEYGGDGEINRTTVQNESSPYSNLTRRALVALDTAQGAAKSIFDAVVRKIALAMLDPSCIAPKDRRIPEEVKGSVLIHIEPCSESSNFSFLVREYDFATLAPKGLVNTRIVDAYMKLLENRSATYQENHCENKPRVAAAQSLFYEEFIKDGKSYEESRLASSKLKSWEMEFFPPNSYDYLLFPIAEARIQCTSAVIEPAPVGDWSLIAVDLKGRHIECFNPKGQDMKESMKRIRDWVVWWLGKRTPSLRDRSIPDDAQQSNGWLAGLSLDKILDLNDLEPKNANGTPPAENISADEWQLHQSSPALQHHVDHNRTIEHDDSGIFICKYADFLSQGIAVGFDTKFINYFRARIAHELLVQRVA